MKIRRAGAVAQFYTPGDYLTIRNLFRRADVAIAGRDGTLVQSGGTGGSSLCPWTGSTIASGGICGFDLPIPGVGSIRFSHAQGQRINIITGTPAATGLTSFALSGFTRTAVESALNEAHFAQFGNVTLTDGVSYALRATVSRGTGSRHAAVYMRRSTGDIRAGFLVDLDTGTATAVATGTGFSTSVSSRALGGGKYLVTALVGASAWGGVCFPVYAPSSSGSSLTITYAGDGVSSVLFEAATLEATSFSGIGLAEGITRTADNILWTPPAAFGQSGELVSLAVPYAWSAASGAAAPDAVNKGVWNISGTGNNFLSRSAAQYVANRADAGGNQAVGDGTNAVDSGVIEHYGVKWDTDLRLYRGATLVATDSTGISAPWNTHTGTVNVAYYPAASTYWFGAVALIYVPGVLTDAERSALARYFNGRVVPILA